MEKTASVKHILRTLLRNPQEGSATRTDFEAEFGEILVHTVRQARLQEHEDEPHRRTVVPAKAYWARQMGILLTIQDRARIQIEGPNRWRAMIQNGSLFPVEASEGLFFLSQGSPELLTVPTGNPQHSMDALFSRKYGGNQYDEIIPDFDTIIKNKD